MISTAFVPISLFLILLYLDYSIFERITLFTILVGFFSGFVIGIIASDSTFGLTWTNSILGLIPAISYNGFWSEFSLYSTLSMGEVSLIRFAILGLKTVKHNINSDNYRIMHRFIWGMFLGPFVYINFNFVKRVIPNTFGLDFLLLAIFYIYLMTFYRKNREVFYLLPGSLERAILISRSGIPMFDYNFKTRSIETPSGNDDKYAEYQILRNIFYATTTVLDDMFQKQINEKDGLRNIMFQKSRIIYFASKNVRWLLIARTTHRIYYQILTQIAKKIENQFQEEFLNMEKGLTASNEFKEGIKLEFAKLM
jgi:hypothetical protein